MPKSTLNLQTKAIETGVQATSIENRWHGIKRTNILCRIRHIWTHLWRYKDCM